MRRAGDSRRSIASSLAFASGSAPLLISAEASAWSISNRYASSP